jgi:hypothetical protein
MPNKLFAPPCLGEALRRGALAKVTLNDFHGFGVNLTGSCPFLLSRIIQFFFSEYTVPVDLL